MTNHVPAYSPEKSQPITEATTRPVVHVCPYLGSWEDPLTARSYVTVENCCHHVKPAATVKAEHQRTYCLTYQHSNCPIYRQQGEINLPSRRLAGAQQPRFLIPALVLGLGVIFILTVVVLAGMSW
ncbi:MAG: hypothetical protein HC804_04245 [Anaerolineae bacterium]|nr:hypothetical protein [Anaerolineae bacterium]